MGITTGLCPPIISSETVQSNTAVNIHVYELSDKTARVMWLFQESQTAINSRRQTVMGQ